MTSFSEYATKDLRLVLLRCLASQTAYVGNDAVLQHEIEVFGLKRSRDVIRAELRWLAEIKAITLKDAGAVFVATLTRRGHEHVQGLTEIEGINKPSPEA